MNDPPCLFSAVKGILGPSGGCVFLFPKALRSRKIASELNRQICTRQVARASLHERIEAVRSLCDPLERP